MEKILLNDILGLTPEEISNTKVKFNVHNGYEDPLDLYKANPDEVNVIWFLWREKVRYFHEGQIAICFLRISNDIWLMTTIKKINAEIDVDPNVGGVGYDATEVKKYQKYFGRLVVKFHNTARTVGRYFESVMNEIEVLEVLNDHFTGNDFPGYENVRLSYGQLKNIIDRQLPGWIAALKNQKAVYLLTDNKTGKQYVGSATAQDGMLLQRWTSYIMDGHGGNTGLIEVVKTKGLDYIKENFQYSILENYNARMDDSYIFKRESWWKATLRTREFGYNKN